MGVGASGRIRTAAVAGVLAVVATACGEGGGDSGELTAALQRQLEMTIVDFGIDGASVAVIDADGELSLASAGVSDRGSTAVDESTRFAIASITKTFTTVIALRLAERGVI